MFRCSFSVLCYICLDSVARALYKLIVGVTRPSHFLSVRSRFLSVSCFPVHMGHVDCIKTFVRSLDLGLPSVNTILVIGLKT